MDEDTPDSQPNPTDKPADNTDQERPLPLDPTGGGETADDPVDDASADSFPASDPPSYTGTTSD